MLATQRFAIPALLSLSVLSGGVFAQDQLFSGPQPGEKLSSLNVKGVFGDQAEKTLTPVDEAAGKPVIIVFLHKLTRPGFALSRTLAAFAASRAEEGLGSTIVMLDDSIDAKRLRTLGRHFPVKKVTVGLTVDGPEGPGAYGLNRNVELTIVVAKEDKVTANFALVQPSVAADGPKVLAAVVDAMGGGDVPDIAEFSNRGMMSRETARMREAAGAKRSEQDARLVGLIRRLLQADNEVDAVDAADKVEAYVKQNEAAQKDLGLRCSRVVSGEKFSTYGKHAKAREYLKKWAGEFGPKQGNAVRKETAGKSR